MKTPDHWQKYYIRLLVQLKQWRKSTQNWYQGIEVELYDLNKSTESFVHAVNIALVFLAVSSLIISEGFVLEEPFTQWNEYVDLIIMGGFYLIYVYRFIVTPSRIGLISNRKIESILMALVLLTGIAYGVGGQSLVESAERFFRVEDIWPLLVLVTKVYLILIIIERFIRAAPIVLSLKRKPAQVVAGSFLTVIATGTLLLMTPNATVDGAGLNLIDALFTSTSAVCVTGLIVVDTATHLTFFGQTTVLVLIQIGGLGVLTLATLFALYMTSGLGVGQMAFIKGTVGESRTSETFSTIRRVVGLTVLIELIGATGYFISWHGLIDDTFERAFFSIFHAVSAFCNAGFSVFTNSLADEMNALNAGINITTMLLVITGGLGFTTLWELIRGNPNHKVRNWHFSIHTQLVLIATVSLISVGTILFLVLEWDGVLSGHSWNNKIMLSLFQSITTRTAGFNTVDIGGMGTSSTLLFLGLMIIGASPASTAGGIKTTTLMVLLLAVKSTILGKKSIEFDGKQISRDTIFTALSVLVLAVVSLFFFTFLLTITEDQAFIDLLFEQFSAFATVGLSRGITGELTTAGKSIIIVSMFIGRVGILTLALAFTRSRTTRNYQYPTESVIVA